MAIKFFNWMMEKYRFRRGSRPPADRESQLPGVLRSGKLSVVLQPIVDLQEGSIFAYEALVRCDSPEFMGPPALFEEAIATKICGALGRSIRELAVEGCPEHPLFLNIHPNEFNEGWLVRPDDPIFCHDRDVYLEITESVPLSHFELCTSVLGEIRSKGVCLAVDDLGAGYSNLKYIVDLTPEIVKLDRTLVANLDSEPRLQRLVHAIVDLCNDLGAKVVAEGLERREELVAARDLGAHLGQGYVLARPAFPAPEIDAELASFIRIDAATRREGLARVGSSPRRRYRGP